MYRSNSETGTVSLKSVVKSRPLNSANRDSEYPAEFMPFYLYGTETEKHISHMLVRAPNITLSASNVTFDKDLNVEGRGLLRAGLILTLSEIPEASKQPFPMGKPLPDPFFFGKGEEFKVDIWKDPKPPRSEGPGLLDRLGVPLHSCTMTLGKHVVVDADEPNKDRFSRIDVDSESWQKELDAIGNILSGSGSHTATVRKE